MRRLLALVGVQNVMAHRTHDLRRGHCQDLIESGATLVEVLRAGEWRSNAFMKYTDADRLEASAVMEAHHIDSSDDSEFELHDFLSDEDSSSI